MLLGLRPLWLLPTRWGDLGRPTLAKARELAIASIKALADQHAANVLPVAA